MCDKVLLDARRLLCPMPVIRVQDCVKTLSPGTLLEAVCTDPGALNDIPAWCRINGHQLVETRAKGDEYFVVIEVCEETQ
ncbi:sulfurtransferase TusA family protein [Candidatus Vondammii sp. HM_W22]|uniref:sulfurtransferase TusA family protein n=1 Tax=Candidatus Vondammii sp. HM_W22 TaxID=2687299 RepID=UPI001F132E4A|nr:sulfurtransferase TusA family protein [Candidatus Vondammii sp. HM_W22]